MLPSTTDELGVYLRKIAKTPLLSRDNERATAEKICQTRHKFLSRLLANDYSLRIVLAAARKAADHKLRTDHVVDLQVIDGHRSHLNRSIANKPCRQEPPTGAQ